jgi:hypothetical protein
VQGFIPVNIDYVNNNPTTSDNREWVCVGEQTGNAEVSSVVVVGANTTTTTQVTSAVGFVAGDTIWLDTTIDKYATIESVNYGTNVITHTSIASPVSPGDIVSVVSYLQSQSNKTEYSITLSTGETIQLQTSPEELRDLHLQPPLRRILRCLKPYL